MSFVRWQSLFLNALFKTRACSEVEFEANMKLNFIDYLFKTLEICINVRTTWFDEPCPQSLLKNLLLNFINSLKCRKIFVYFIYTYYMQL